MANSQCLRYQTCADNGPADTLSVTLIISVSGCLSKMSEPLGSETHTMEIPYNYSLVPTQLLEFHVATSAGSLTVTAARLIYKKVDYNSWTAINKEAFMPTGMIDARYW